MSAPLLTPAGVAALLGVPLSTFRRAVVALREREAFPAPLPGMGGRYDPLAIERWRRERAGLGQTTDVGRPTSEDDVAAWQARLDARSVQIGRPEGRA